MPKYQVKTNAGTFEVTLNRAPESREELMATIEAQLTQGGGDIEVGQPLAIPTQPQPAHQPGGFKQALLPPFARTGAPQGGSAVIKALEALNVPFEMAGEAVKGLVQPPLERGLKAVAPFTLPRLIGLEKVTPEQEAATAREIAEFPAEAASQAIQFFGPGKVVSGVQRGIKVAAKILPGSQVARMEGAIESTGRILTGKSTAATARFAQAKTALEPLKQQTTPLANLTQVLDDIIGTESQLSRAAKDTEILRDAKSLKAIIQQKEVMGIEQLDREISGIGEKVNALASQGKRVHRGYSQVFKALAQDLEGTEAGVKLLAKNKAYRQMKGMEEVQTLFDDMVKTKRGMSGAQDVNANQVLDKLKKKEFLLDSLPKEDLADVRAIFSKMGDLPMLPPPRGGMFGAGRFAGTTGVASLAAQGMGLDPLTTGLAVAGLADLSRFLLPSRIGRKALRAVLESGPIDQNKINMLNAVARGISGMNLAPPQAPKAIARSQ